MFVRVRPVVIIIVPRTLQHEFGTDWLKFCMDIQTKPKLKVSLAQPDPLGRWLVPARKLQKSRGANGLLPRFAHR